MLSTAVLFSFPNKVNLLEIFRALSNHLKPIFHTCCKPSQIVFVVLSRLNDTTCD